MSDCASVWKSIPGYPLYQAADDGRIRTLRCDPPRVLSQRPHNRYLHVQIVTPPHGKQRKVPVHRLVLLAFAGPRPAPGQICRHLNGVRFDNRAGNLRWGTHAENVADTIAHGTASCVQHGQRHPGAKLTDSEYAELVERIGRGEWYAALARAFHLHPTYVGKIASGRGRKAARTSPCPCPAPAPNPTPDAQTGQAGGSGIGRHGRSAPAIPMPAVTIPNRDRVAGGR